MIAGLSAALHRARERLVSERTALINHLRALHLDIRLRLDALDKVIGHSRLQTSATGQQPFFNFSGIKITGEP